MAEFSRFDNRYDNRGNRRSEEELNRMEEEFNKEKQLKFKKMTKLIGAAVMGFFLLIFLFMELII